MMKNHKIIISGPPGSGKTSIINALKNKGYLVQNELHPGKINKESDKLELSNYLFSKRIKQYHDKTIIKSNKHNIKLTYEHPLIFFDRSIIDVIAYLNMWKIKFPIKMNTAIKKYNYNKNIFYTPCWKKIYKTTPHRPENYENSIKIDIFLRNAYIEFNYNIIEVPKLDVNKRVDFIINNL
ncbi:MAG: hypothetical protein CMP49_06370 [Flavobacteriales bacterium]|nr:hypothetical protein [Flavobacteriales bacterium]|tara:strand:- start:6350 stop:6892 length:543 start_codon:yes stop_codon:yes gene_type:complete